MSDNESLISVSSTISMESQSILLDEDRPQPLGEEVEPRQRVDKNKKKKPTPSELPTSGAATGASGSLRPLSPLEGMPPVPPPRALLDQIRSWPDSQKRIWDYPEYYDFILNHSGRQRGEKPEEEDEKKEGADKKTLEKPQDDGETLVKKPNPPTQPRFDMTRSTSIPSTSSANVENRRDRKKRTGQWPQMNIRFGKQFRVTSGSIKVQATARVPQAYEYDGITIVRTWQRESEPPKEFTLSMSAMDMRRLYQALKRILNNAK